jgi:integrase
LSGASDNIPWVLSSDILAAYELWLTGTPLATRTRANYRRWVAELEDLAAGDELAAFLSPADEHDRRALLTNWRRRLVDRGLEPATINLAAAATSLLDSRALASPTVARVHVAAGDARALKPVELRELEEDDRRLAAARPRDPAVLVRTGLRIGEVAAPDRATYRSRSARGRSSCVTQGRPLPRRPAESQRTSGAQRVARRARAPSPRAARCRDRGLAVAVAHRRAPVGPIVEPIAAGVMASAGIAETAHGLRHTLATRLVREHGRDIVLVADLLGPPRHQDDGALRTREREDQRAAVEGSDAA